MKIRFLGGVGTVTGSKYLLETGRARLLIDCGLFQGFKNLRQRNWASLPVPPASIDAVILTHAHIDHSGYLPLLVKNGFKGPVHATSGTADLCAILLPDSGYLHEKDAEFANRYGYSKHHPALPLYTQKDAIDSLEQLKPANFGEEIVVAGGVRVRFHPAGHILGAAMLTLETDAGRIVFSGDLGRRNDPVMLPPAAIDQADWLVVESTYGDRFHNGEDAESALAAVISRTAARGGTVLIPSFAVGRAQLLMYHIHRLKAEKRIPDLPVYLDSPMAINASDMFCRHVDEHRLSPGDCRQIFGEVRYVHEPEESKKLDRDPLPKVILSASGMATGGRVLHHLKHFAPDPRNTVLFAGYQAGGTRGAAMIDGAKSVKIHGGHVPVNAEVDMLSMLSAHADQREILDWLGHFKQPPRRTFITHGEPAAADALRRRIEEDFGWNVTVPDYRDEIELI